MSNWSVATREPSCASPHRPALANRFLSRSQGYKYFVEPGRVAVVNFGDDFGKQVVIVDVADQNRVLVDGENFPRTLYPLKRLTLTKLKVDIARGARTGTLAKVTKAADLAGQWKKTSIARKLARKETREGLSDLQRFQVMINRKRRSYEVRKLAKKAIKK